MAGVDDGLGREAIRERPHRIEQRVPVGTGKICAADGACEEKIAAEEAPVRVEGDVRGRVARDRDAFKGEARDLDRLAAAEQVVGVYGRPAAPTGANSG